MLPLNYQIRLMGPSDFEEISEICKLVYPAETPYTLEELEAHHRVFPQGQFVALYSPQGAVAGVHFTLRLRMIDFHLDDPWDVLTARGTFSDHNPVTGHTLYGADIMVHPVHQHHGIAHALTDITRILVREEGLWRMVGASRLPGYGKRCALMDPEQYVDAVERGELVDPVLTAHLRDGWTVVRPIHGYLSHDDESDGWAAVIQWVNPECPPPPEFELR
jgi:GNAT superfamily N-acetyltransferase